MKEIIWEDTGDWRPIKKVFKAKKKLKFVYTFAQSDKPEPSHKKKK